MKTYKYTIDRERSGLLDAVRADARNGIFRIDINEEKNLIRIVADRSSDEVIAWASANGIYLKPHESSGLRETTLSVGGMTCHSCEVTLERALGAIGGVRSVKAQASRGRIHIAYGDATDMDDVRKAIEAEGYQLLSSARHSGATNTYRKQRPSIVRLIGFFVLALAVGMLLNRLNLLTPSASVGDTVSLGAVFVLGLFAASSSCIAVSGGLLLSSAAKWNEHYGTGEGWGRMQPVLFFIFGRIISYLLFGSLIGFIGQTFSPSPLVTGIITVCAALFMIIMGLDMLGMAPQWLLRAVPRMPKNLSHAILDRKSSQSLLAPIFLGGATFFLPCGFTQSLQLYALTTGSALTSGLLLGVFALGTAPALFGLGWASTSLKGKVGTIFFQFSGVIVLLLGIWNIQNGFTAAGYPLSLPRLQWNATDSRFGDPNVVYDGKVQTVRMIANASGYSPNRVTVQANIPVKWIVDGTNAEGCVSVFQAPRLGIKKLLSRGENVFEFTPTTPGTYAFSCSMGMYRGNIVVVPKT